MILDTNSLSAFAEGVPAVGEIIRSAPELHVPVIVLGEFRYGISVSRYAREYERWLTRGRAFWNVLSIDEGTTVHYAAIRQELRKNGTPIPANDSWIAALARQHMFPIMSQDAHFDAVSDVTRIGW